MHLKYALSAILCTAAPLAAQPQASATGTLRGSVFDSLQRTPAAGAVVWIPGSARTTVADAKGHFTLTDVPAGLQFVAFSSPALDSLGLGTLGARAVVAANGVTDTRLATPAFSTLWRSLCGTALNIVADSGIVWGTIRDAATDVRQSGARASFAWSELQVSADKKVETRDVGRDVRTDSTATYYVCGLPSEITISSRADGAHAASGVVQYIIGARRLRRVDLLVSADMAGGTETPTVRSDSTVHAPALHGSAVVRGVVRDERERALADVELAVTSVDTVVRTNAHGEFALAGLPAGTHDMEFRRVGFGPARVSVDLRGGATTDVGIVMTSTQTLAKIEVLGDETSSHADREDFEKRRKAGFGYSFTEKDFKNKDLGLVPVLSGVPGITVRRTPGGVSISMSRLSGGPGTECTPVFWTDGVRDPDGLTTLTRPLETFRAIEVFPHAMSAPAQYIGSCGVVLIWTKLARW